MSHTINPSFSRCSVNVQIMTLKSLFLELFHSFLFLFPIDFVHFVTFLSACTISDIASGWFP